MSIKTVQSTRSKILIFISLLLCVAIIYGTVFFLFFRKTPGKNLYTLSSDISMEKASQQIASAQAKNNAAKDIQYTYDFAVNYKSGSSLFRFGTKNIISLSKDAGTGHRLNIYTSLREGTQQQSKTENFYFEDGKIYTKRFGKNYSSDMEFADFIPYTEYSGMSVNVNYLDERFFKKAKAYNLFGKEIEIAFTDADSALTDGIISFIGLDQTSFEYKIYDVALSVIISENGLISEKHLLFSVDYHASGDEDNTVTYQGDFAYILNKTSDVEVGKRSKEVIYQNISGINLLSSLTESGYNILFTRQGIDVTYSKVITLSDSSGGIYTYNGNIDLVAINKNGKLYYSSIDTDRHSSNELIHNTAGIFISENGYTEKIYDYVKNEVTSSIDNREHDYTSDDITNAVMTAIAGERLYEEEIYSVSVLSEDEHSVTYSVTITADANKSFASYLISMFSESGSGTADISQFAFTSSKCDFTIKVRKSDACILYQLIDYSATIYSFGSSITVESRCEMTVNGTGDTLELLTPEDWSETVDNIKNS